MDVAHRLDTQLSTVSSIVLFHPRRTHRRPWHSISGKYPSRPGLRAGLVVLVGRVGRRRQLVRPVPLVPSGLAGLVRRLCRHLLAVLVVLEVRGLLLLLALLGATAHRRLVLLDLPVVRRVQLLQVVLVVPSGLVVRVRRRLQICLLVRHLRGHLVLLVVLVGRVVQPGTACTGAV